MSIKSLLNIMNWVLTIIITRNYVINRGLNSMDYVGILVVFINIMYISYINVIVEGKQ